MVYKPSPEQSGQLRDGAGIYVHERIGDNTIQGLQTIGMRDTTTINVGIIGNDHEFSIVREFWYSPKLGFNLLSSLRDARYGTQIFKMTELTEASRRPRGSKYLRDIRSRPRAAAFRRFDKDEARDNSPRL
jgi:hypothetical protein